MKPRKRCPGPREPSWTTRIFGFPSRYSLPRSVGEGVAARNVARARSRTFGGVNRRRAGHDAAVRTGRPEETFFGLRLEDHLGQEILQIVESAYPHEGCGLAFAPSGESVISRVVQIDNAQGELHAEDPVRHPSPRRAFTFAPRAHLRALMAADAAGLEPRVIFHSHCDAASYFSESDRIGALVGDGPRFPDAVHLVVSVVGGRATDAAVYRYHGASRRFVERRLARWVSRLRPASVTRRRRRRAMSQTRAFVPGRWGPG